MPANTAGPLSPLWTCSLLCAVPFFCFLPHAVSPLKAGTIPSIPVLVRAQDVNMPAVNTHLNDDSCMMSHLIDRSLDRWMPGSVLVPWANAKYRN